MTAGVEQITTWILARHPEVNSIDPDHDLIESRLIDSLGFIEFVLLIQRLAGRPIDIEAAGIESFRSLKNIEQVFFSHQPS